MALRRMESPMKRYTPHLFVAAATVVLCAALLPSSARSQIGYLAGVRLQAVTPGTSDTGHANITGTMRAGTFMGGGSGLTSLNANQLTMGSVSPARGGTGIDTSAAAPGSLLYTSGAGTWAVRSAGAPGQVLKMSGNAPQWAEDNTGNYNAGSGLQLANGVFSVAQLGIVDSMVNDVSWGKVSGAPNFLVAVVGTPRLSGSGTGANPLDLAQQNAAVGQALKWSGSNWAPAEDANNTYTAGTGLLLSQNRFSIDTSIVATLVGNQTFTGFTTFSAAPSFTSGGAPFSVTSNTLVANLNADLLDGMNSMAFLQSVPNPLTLSGASNSHIIRAENSSTTNNSTGLWGLITGATGTTRGVYGQSDSTSGRGVAGSASASTGATYGGYFTSLSTSGYGVSGLALAATGTTYGIYGQSDSTSGRGVYGTAGAASGTTYGGYFSSNSTSGRGVYGLASAGTGITYGGSFQSDANQGRGVYGLATSPNDIAYGGYFQSDSISGRGVRGWASAATGTTFGGYFTSDSASGRGIHGEATHAGVNSTPYGVLGICSTATMGFAVYASGDTGSSGTKSFRIDHPFDPENKYLLHYSAESPFPQNFYSGNATTDEKGYAWIELPDYFAEINANFKYQLTVVDEADSDRFVWAKVVRKIRGNRFRIRSNMPGVEVSWRVEADRNDLRVRSNRPTDTRPKTGPEKGKYQHPEFYGLPPEMGMNSRPELDKGPQKRR